MKRYYSLTFGVLLFFLLPDSLFQKSQGVAQRRLSAPTYYLAVAGTCDPSEVRAYGASNLPPGSAVILTVSDFDGDGWREYSEESIAIVDDEGLFAAKIRPSKGFMFRRNLILLADFLPYRPRQPQRVLDVVGKRGEQLGDLLANPQLHQMSGPTYVLRTMDRLHC